MISIVLPSEWKLKIVIRSKMNKVEQPSPGCDSRVT